MSDTYTVFSLSNACGISISQLNRHVKQGTCRINTAKERVPGIGVVFKGAQVAKFVHLMQSKRRFKQPASQPV